MEPVEDTDGKSHVAQYCPQIWTIELYLILLVVIAPDQEGLHDVDREVGHDQESDGVPSSHSFLGSSRV